MGAVRFVPCQGDIQHCRRIVIFRILEAIGCVLS